MIIFVLYITLNICFIVFNINTMKTLIYIILLFVSALPVLGQSALSHTEEFVFTPSIQLHSFIATSQENRVELEWATEWEKDFDFFTIERAASNVEFKELGTVKGKGSTSTEMSYNFTDKEPLIGQVFYRLKVTNSDGTMEYNKMISVYYEGQTASLSELYPHVVNQHHLVWEPSKAPVREVKLLDLSGQMVYSHIAQNNIHELPLPKEIKPGSYLLIVLDCQGEQHQQKIMIL